MTDVDQLRQRLAEMVSEATNGEVSAADALTAESMVALGVDSLGLVRLVDAIEQEYDVEIELHDPRRRLDNLDQLVAVLRSGRPGPPE